MASFLQRRSGDPKTSGIVIPRLLRACLTSLFWCFCSFTFKTGLITIMVLTIQAMLHFCGVKAFKVALGRYVLHGQRIFQPGVYILIKSSFFFPPLRERKYFLYCCSCHLANRSTFKFFLVPSSPTPGQYFLHG